MGRAQFRERDVRRVRVKLVSHLRRSRFLQAFPGLPAWAKLCRAYGAGLEWWTRGAVRVGKRRGLCGDRCGHGYVGGLCRTYGARNFLRTFPGLPAWAKLCRAYGAGSEWRTRGAVIAGSNPAARRCETCVA